LIRTHPRSQNVGKHDLLCVLHKIVVSFFQPSVTH
jgi:hypothetical protein